jgi:hypothetical protein
MLGIKKLLLVIQLLSASSLSFAEVLVPAKLSDQSPREDVRRGIFPDGTPDKACKIVSKDPAGAVLVDPGLTSVIQSLIRGISASDEKVLLPLFHPQIKVKSAQVKAALMSIQRISGSKTDATLFRAYGINNISGDSGAVHCAEDGLLLHPLYGHPLQAGVWIQAMGQDEVTRVYVILIPSKDKWRIGAWHVQQWTHAGKDYTTWRQEAETLAAGKEDLAAWLYFDLTAKLLDGGKFIVFPVAEDIAAERTKLLGGKVVLDLLQAKVPGDKLVYASSLFSRKGASFLLRFGIPGEWSANAIREHCRAKYKQLIQESWMKSVAGIRCDYVLPKESTQKEGALGGIFIDQASLDAK